MHEAALPALTSVVIVSVVSFVGAVALALGPARVRGVVPFLVAISAGALLGDAFLHLLPEAAEQHGGFGGAVAWCTLGGVLFFFLVESVIHWHHHGDDMEAHAHGHGNVSSLAWMNLLGDGLHNFVDGILIAGTWMVSPEAGLATTVAVALHEIPQEFGDFGVLLHAGLPVKKALLLNAASASLAILGAALILVAGSELGIEPYLGPIAAGGFIYVACADLVPELHKRARGRQLPATLIALALGITVVTALPALVGGHAHGHAGHGHDALEGHEHGEDAGHDDEHDGEHDGDHDGDHDGEHDGEHDGDHDGDHDGEHEHEHGDDPEDRNHDDHDDHDDEP